MDKKTKGYLYLTISTAIYGLFGVLTRNFSNFSPFSQSWVKAFFTVSIIILLFLFGRTSWKKIRREDIKWFLVWILPASFQPVLTYLAFINLPVGLVYFLTYSTTILGGILSGKIFFSEKLSTNKIFSVVMLLAGLLLIYGSNLKSGGNFYMVLALLSGFIVGFWNTLTKKVSGNYSSFQMILLDNGTSLVLCFSASLLLSEKLVPLSNTTSWLWIFAFSVAALAAGIFMIKGFKEVEAQIGSLIMPMEIVFGTAFGYIFLHEVLRMNTYIGGFLIFLAAIISTFNKSEPVG